MTGPEVTLEWSPNDDSPPCIDFTCVCGHWRHLCNGPDWITEGRGQVPGVKCVKCGAAWSLYRVRTGKTPTPERAIDMTDKPTCVICTDDLPWGAAKCYLGVDDVARALIRRAVKAERTRLTAQLRQVISSVQDSGDLTELDALADEWEAGTDG